MGIEPEVVGNCPECGFPIYLTKKHKITKSIFERTKRSCPEDCSFGDEGDDDDV